VKMLLGPVKRIRRADADVVMICVPCLLVGGTEIHTRSLAVSLAANGYRVVVCCYFEHDPIMVESLRQSGVELELLDLNRWQSSGRAGRQAWNLARALAGCFRRHRPKLVHVQYMTPGVLPVVLARAAGIPIVVATVHVTASHYGRRTWLPRRVAAPLCNTFLCVSQVAEESFFGRSEIFSEAGLRGGRRHFTIPNGIDLRAVDLVLASGRPDELAAKLNLASRPVVGIVGRLDRFKGHDFLLEAFAVVRRDVPDAVLLCVGAGAGPWRDHLLAEASRLGLRDHVIWTGGMAQESAFRHLMLMDLVAMPSRPGLEGFGLSAAEAMAFGKPLVASDVDGLAEVVGREGDGLLVPSGDISALAQVILDLLRDPSQRRALGIAGRRRVEHHFSMDLFADRHVRLYRSLSEARA
jgi:glycosyltransferase involved in cell wall biosynthesis